MILDSHFHTLSMARREVDMDLEKIIGIDVGTDPFDIEDRLVYIKGRENIYYSQGAGPWCLKDGEVNEIYSRLVSSFEKYKGTFLGETGLDYFHKDYGDKREMIKLFLKQIELAEKAGKNLLELDSEKASAIARLKGDLKIFKRQRGRYYSQLDAIKKNKEIEAASVQSDFSALKEFFPEAELSYERLAEVEAFHKDLTSILKSDFKEAEQKIWNLINLINIQIENIENEMHEIEAAEGISKIVLEEYAKIEKEIVALQDQNNRYDQNEGLAKDLKEKTETLTKNQMEVISIYANNNILFKEDVLKNSKLLEILYYANGAYLSEDNKYTGDSVDVALKNYIKDNDIKINKYQKIVELPFDSDRKMMSAIYKNDSSYTMYTKGSLESVLSLSTRVLIDDKEVKLTDKLKKEILSVEEKFSFEALKVLALAYKKIDKKYKNEEDYFKEEKDLVLVGLVGLKDPVRPNVKDAIKTCQEANIRPIMVTGDNLPTALSIAKEIGICTSDSEGINASELNNLSEKELVKYANKYSVFARVSPDNKLQLVKALQKTGKVVAMTGDGVNDAPAIKLANVGVGMGKSGTDVTKGVADIILLDDSFTTITTAVKEGRRIYDNVISNILYNLSSNFTEIAIILFGLFTGNTIISAIHVLYIDLVADTVPSITLAFEKASKDTMKRKPNGLNKRIFTSFFSSILIASVILETIISLIVYYHFKSQGVMLAQTLALLSIIINEFVFAYNCRSLKERITKRGLFSNKYLNLGILTLLIVQAIVFFTPIGKIFGLTIISLSQFIYVILINIISFIILEILKPLLVKLFKDE